MAELNELAQIMGDLDEDTMIEILNGVMEDGGSKAQEAMEACQEGMNIVGKLFEDGEYFVGDLIYAGELMTQAVDILKPALMDGESKAAGKVLLCTVAGDLHDIGKNIVHAMLEASGITVVDLGIDVKPEKVVETMQAEGIHVAILSGVLTLAVDSMKATVDAIKAAGLDAKILIGGAPVNEDARILTGADEWAYSPQKTVKCSQEWLAAYAS